MDIVVGPADTTIHATLCLTCAARSLVNSPTKLAGRTRDAGEEGFTSVPYYRVTCSNGEIGGTSALLDGGGGIASDGGQQKFDISSHIWVVGVKWLRVGSRCYQFGLFLVATASSWIESSEPCLSSGVVTSELDIDVEQAQVALGIGEIICGDMCNDEAASIDWLSDDARDLGKAEQKTGNDGGGEHL